MREHQVDYASEWEAIKTVTKRLGMAPVTLASESDRPRSMRARSKESG